MLTSLLTLGLVTGGSLVLLVVVTGLLFSVPGQWVMSGGPRSCELISGGISGVNFSTDGGFNDNAFLTCTL